MNDEEMQTIENLNKILGEINLKTLIRIIQERDELKQENEKLSHREFTMIPYHNGTAVFKIESAKEIRKLEQQLSNKEAIIKEAREYIESAIKCADLDEDMHYLKLILTILDKE